MPAARRYGLRRGDAGGDASPSPATDHATGECARHWLDCARSRAILSRISAADSVLQQRPHDHAAIVLKIQALASAADINGAIEATPPGPRHIVEPDLHLLGITAEAVLAQVAANGPEMAQRVAALEALAGAGDKLAAETLAGLGPSAGVEGEPAKARLGDPAAAEAIAKRLAANPKIQI